MIRLKVIQIGRSAGVILPMDVLSRLGIHKGDELLLVETPGGYAVSSYDPHFAKQMESAQKGMATYKNTLRELAK